MTIMRVGGKEEVSLVLTGHPTSLVGRVAPSNPNAEKPDPCHSRKQTPALMQRLCAARFPEGIGHLYQGARSAAGVDRKTTANEFDPLLHTAEPHALIRLIGG